MTRRGMLLVAVFLGSGGSVAAQADSDSVAAPPAVAALYTSDQARRGQKTYERNCVNCHNASAYSGAVFRRVWGGRSAFEIWEQIRTTMPQDAPGRLKPGDYADIVAYLLRLNRYPAGEEELPADADRLRQLMIAPSPPPRPRSP